MRGTVTSELIFEPIFQTEHYFTVHLNLNILGSRFLLKERGDSFKQRCQCPGAKLE